MEKSASRTWDSASALIMLTVVLLSSWRLQATNWTEGLGQIHNIAVLAFGLGLALGYSRFSKRTVVWLTLAYMAVFIPWQLLGAISFGKDQTDLLEKLAIVFGRLFAGIKELAGGREVPDQFFIVALMSLPFWFVSLYSGYQLTRYANFLKTLLPNGVLMFIIHVSYFTTKDYAWMFSLYFFLALILLSRLKYLEDRQKWAQTRVLVSNESELDIATTSLVLTASLIMLAWAVPYIISPSAEGVAFWRNLSSSDRFENLFASVNKEKRPQPRNFQTQLKLGTQTPLGDQVVFKVYAPQNTDEFPRMYWRGQVYDRFENGSWEITSEDEIRRFPTEGDIDIPGNDPRRRMSFTFDIATDGQTVLYMPSQPIWVNQDAIMLYSEVSEGVFDAMAFRAILPLKQGDLYRATGLFVNPTISELQQSSQEYPGWTLTKYLQLPDDFSPRIRQLAQEITASYDNPYDKATAITHYLRSEIKYSNSVELPTNNPDSPVDPLEYVLFEGKKGFCNYYASLEVLMLRSLGIPARLAVGYAQGEPNLQNSLYVVRERDLHAWSEVYFPDIGWIEFEPTANQDVLERPEIRVEPQLAVPFINPATKTPFDEEPLEQEIATEDELAQEQSSANPWLNGLISALPWMGGVLFILIVIRMQRRFAPALTPAFILRRVIERSGSTPPKWIEQSLILASLPPIESYFHSINLALTWLKRPQPAHISPAERAWILKHILPEAAEDIERLLNEHQAQLFSPHAGSEPSARRAARRILAKGLQKRLKIIILGYNYAEIQEPPRYPPL